MSKNIFRDVKHGIFLKVRKRDICFYYFTDPYIKQKVEDFLKKEENNNKKSFITCNAYIYKFVDNSKINYTPVISVYIDRNNHEIYNPSDEEIELYESIYKTFRKEINDKIREERIKNIIYKFEPLSTLTMRLETYYFIYKNDISEIIAGYAFNLADTQFQKKLKRYIKHLTNYRHFDIHNNIKDTIINDVFSFISGTRQFMLNVYNYDTCVIAEKTGKHNINLFIKTYTKINNNIDIKKNATFLNKKNNKNIIKELSEFVTNNIE